MTRRDLVLFLATLFAATWAVELLAIARVGDMSNTAVLPYLLVCMFLPTVWTLAWLWRRPDLRGAVRWRLGRPLPSLAGALVPALIALVAVLVLVVAGLATSNQFAFAAGGAEVLRGPWLLGKGAQGWPLFLLNFAVTGLLYAVLNSSAAIGEEIGWRGLLQNQLIDRYGALRGVGLLGLVWAFWHLPVNLAGYNHPDHPVLGGFVIFPLSLVADSFVMAWLTRRSGSFWPAVLYHGSGNGILEGVAVSGIVPTGSRLVCTLVLLGITGVAGALAAWSLVRDERRRSRAAAGTDSQAAAEPLVRAA